MVFPRDGYNTICMVVMHLVNGLHASSHGVSKRKVEYCMLGSYMHMHAITECWRAWNYYKLALLKFLSNCGCDAGIRGAWYMAVVIVFECINASIRVCYGSSHLQFCFVCKPCAAFTNVALCMGWNLNEFDNSIVAVFIFAKFITVMLEIFSNSFQLTHTHADTRCAQPRNHEYAGVAFCVCDAKNNFCIGRFSENTTIRLPRNGAEGWGGIFIKMSMHSV